MWVDNGIVGWFFDIYLLKGGGDTDIFTGFFLSWWAFFAINSYKYRDSR